MRFSLGHMINFKCVTGWLVKGIVVSLTFSAFLCENDSRALSLEQDEKLTLFKVLNLV